MRLALPTGLLGFALSACGAQVAGTPPAADEPIDTTDEEPADPDQGLGDDDEDQDVDPPGGAAGVCWDDAFDDDCSRQRASGHWRLALFPGDTELAALVSTDGAANAVLVSWGPAGADRSVGWSDTLIERAGRIGAIRLLVPGVGESVTARHAIAESTTAAWQQGWQEAPTGLVAAAFTRAYHEVDGQGLGWSVGVTGGIVEAVHTVTVGTVQHEHRVVVDAQGGISFRYRRLEGAIEAESLSSDDGQVWTRAGADDVTIEAIGEVLRWEIDLPASIPAAEQQYLEGWSSRLGPELGWLEGDFVGLGAALVGGYGILSDLWVDPATASIRSVAMVFWDGTDLREWDASDGSLVDGSEFPATYQDDHGSRVVIEDAGTAFAAIEAIEEESQLRVIAEDLLPVGAAGLAAAYRWEVVFEPTAGLATGEVAVERTDAGGCERGESYDFGASWADGPCE